MNQAKHLFVTRKYYSILTSVVAVELVSYVVSLVDTIVAGNIMGYDALVSVGLVSPVLYIGLFITSTVCTGTILNYSSLIGKFEEKKAIDFFHHGLMLGAVVGVLFTTILFLLRGVFVAGLNVSEIMMQYASDYYIIIIFCCMLDPVRFILDNIIIIDGNEKFSAAANVIQIIGNVIFSVMLSKIWGVKGIAASTVLCKFLFIVIASVYFLSKKKIKFSLKNIRLKNFAIIINSGVVKATTFMMPALMMLIINDAVQDHYSADILPVLITVEKIWSFSDIFLGMAMAIVPIVDTFRGEGNTKAIRMFMHSSFMTLFLFGCVFCVLFCIFAQFIVRLLGVNLFDTGNLVVFAARITSVSFVFRSVLTLFFIYYLIIEKRLLAFLICAMKDLICPILCVQLSVRILDSSNEIWIGLSASPIMTIIISILLVMIFFRKKNQVSFPYLLPKESENKIFIYNFIVSNETAVDMSKTLIQLLAENHFAKNIRQKAGILIEELLIDIFEKNAGGKPVNVECTLIFNDKIPKLIIRDNGVIFDLTDSDSQMQFLRQYIKNSIMILFEKRAYLKTTGYNRNIIYLS